MKPVQIDYHVQIWKAGPHYVAHAMPLDVASAGSTPDAARQALDEAVRLFLNTAAAHGTLAEVLADAGYEAADSADGWRGPAWVAMEHRHATVGA